MKQMVVTLFILACAMIVNQVYAVGAQIGGQQNGYQCHGGDANRWKIESGNSATLPATYTFETITVKAGQDCITVYPVNSAPSCYQVDLTDTTVTVTKIGAGSSCKDISHLEGTYNLVQSPSPSPSLSPSPSPSLDPSPSPSLSPSPSPSLDPSPSPSVSPTPTPTPTPGNNNNNDSGSSDNNSSNNSTEPEGEILGAYAETGVVEDAIMNALGYVGGLMSTIGSALYGKKKSKK